jgi:hypothetical protein
MTNHRESASFHWIVLGILVLAHAGVGALLNPAGHPNALPNNPVVPVALGVLFSQPLLFAFWTAFAPQRFYHRLLWGLLLCASVAFAVEAGGLSSENDSFRGGCYARGFFLSIDMILFLAATPLLLLVRRLTGWKLTCSDAEPAPSDYRARQFGIKHFLILTTIAAFVCGLFRTISVIDPTVSVKPVAEVAKTVLQITFALLPVALIPWFTLGYHKRVWVSLLWAIVVVAISVVACCFLLPVRQSPVLIQMILLIQFGAGLSVFISTFVMRQCGFRGRRQAGALNTDLNTTPTP